MKIHTVVNTDADRHSALLPRTYTATNSAGNVLLTDVFVNFT